MPEAAKFERGKLIPALKERELPKSETEGVGKRIKERAELSKTEKAAIDKFLLRETDRIKMDYAAEWYADHEEKLKDKGVYLDDANPEYKWEITDEYGGFKKLDKETGKKLNQTDSLRINLKKKEIPNQSRRLMLNGFNKRLETLGTQLTEARESGDKSQANELEKEIKELSEVTKNLAEKTTFRDLKKEAEGKVKREENRMGLLESTFGGGLKQLLERKGKVKGEIRDKITEIAGAPEEAVIRGERAEDVIMGTEAAFTESIERLNTEFLTKGLNHAEKTAAELKYIEKEFTGMGGDPNELVYNIFNRRGLESLTGTWDTDLHIFREFFNRHGVGLTPEILNEAGEAVKRERGGKTYDAGLLGEGKEFGFIDWLIALIFQSLRLPKEAERT